MSVVDLYNIAFAAVSCFGLLFLLWLVKPCALVCIQKTSCTQYKHKHTNSQSGKLIAFPLLFLSGNSFTHASAFTITNTSSLLLASVLNILQYPSSPIHPNRHDSILATFSTVVSSLICCGNTFRVCMMVPMTLPLATFYQILAHWELAPVCLLFLQQLRRSKEHRIAACCKGAKVVSKSCNALVLQTCVLKSGRSVHSEWLWLCWLNLCKHKLNSELGNQRICRSFISSWAAIAIECEFSVR